MLSISDLCQVWEPLSSPPCRNELLRIVSTVLLRLPGHGHVGLSTSPHCCLSLSSVRVSQPRVKSTRAPARFKCVKSTVQTAGNSETEQGMPTENPSSVLGSLLWRKNGVEAKADVMNVHIRTELEPYITPASVTAFACSIYSLPVLTGV